MDQTWVWEATWQDEDQMPVWAEYDDLNSTVDSADLMFNEDTLSHPRDWTGKAILRCRFGLKRINSLSCLPNTNASPLIDRLLQKTLLEYVGNDRVYFYPAEVKARDGITNKFNFAIPLLSVTCIDLENTKGAGRFEHSEPNELWGFRTAKHLPHCLGGNHFVRDKVYTPHVVVSDELKTALLASGDPGLAFHKIEEFYGVGYYES